MKGLASRAYVVVVVVVVILSPFQVQSAENVTYGFGVVPQFEQRKLFRIWHPILDELEKRTGLHFKLVGSAKIPVFEEKFIAGAYDFAYMNPYHLLMANDAQGYLPLIRDGGRVLKGILVVARESPVKNVRELAGKRTRIWPANTARCSG